MKEIPGYSTRKICNHCDEEINLVIKLRPERQIVEVEINAPKYFETLTYRDLIIGGIRTELERELDALLEKMNKEWVHRKKTSLTKRPSEVLDEDK